MISDPRFIIIAGTARNVGKTTLACELIQSFSDRNIIALKFITLKKNGFKHAHHQNVETFELIEEQIQISKEGSEKDTAKMLRSGAKQSFMLVSQEESIPEALETFLSKVNDDTIVIAESATLRKYLKPASFIIVDRPDAENKKPYINKLLPLSDFQISDIKDKEQVSELMLSLQNTI